MISFIGNVLNGLIYGDKKDISNSEKLEEETGETRAVGKFLKFIVVIVALFWEHTKIN